jgi:hypothetical protein
MEHAMVADALSALGEAALDAEGALRGRAAVLGEAPLSRDDRRPDRAGRRAVSFYTSIEARKQLHHLAVDTELTVEDHCNRALNLLFRAQGLPEIAPSRDQAQPFASYDAAGTEQLAP